MIKLACEAPLRWMNETSKHVDFEYALAHRVLEDSSSGEAYARFFRNALALNKEVILDNSAFELKKAFSNKKLFDAYSMIRVADKEHKLFVIAPDVLGKKDANTKSIVDFSNEYPVIKKKQTYATIQGLNNDERLKSYLELATAGYTRFTVPGGWSMKSGIFKREVEISRLSLFCKMREYFAESHKFHLLGCQDLSLLSEYSNYSQIVSIDTSFPVALALEGSKLGPVSIKPKTLIDKNFEICKEVPPTLKSNIIKFREFLK